MSSSSILRRRRCFSLSHQREFSTRGQNYFQHILCEKHFEPNFSPFFYREFKHVEKGRRERERRKMGGGQPLVLAIGAAPAGWTPPTAFKGLSGTCRLMTSLLSMVRLHSEQGRLSRRACRQGFHPQQRLSTQDGLFICC